MREKTWRDAPGYEGLYAVSEAGDVKNLVSGKVLSPYRLPNGYLQVTLCGHGLRVKWYVHRLVALVFLGVCPAGQEVMHLDGSRDNNARHNLKYGTRKENLSHTKLHGTAPVGERHGGAVLTDDMVRTLRSVPKESLAGTARSLGVKYATAWAARSRKNWAHI